MALFHVEFQVANNADWEDQFTLTDINGAAINLTGASFEMDIRSVGGVQLAQLDTAAGTMPILDATAGKFGVKVAAATMAGLAPGIYYLDCVLSETSPARKLRLFEGRVLIEKGITT
jgi:hypothetical protein